MIVHRGNAAGITVLVPGDVLTALGVQCPGVLDRVLTETGMVREHVHVFVGEENIKFGLGLDESVRAGDEVQILHAVSGG